MSKRTVSEDSLDSLRWLIEEVRNRTDIIESDLENDDPELYKKEYEKDFAELNSLLRQLEDEIKYL